MFSLSYSKYLEVGGLLHVELYPQKDHGTKFPQGLQKQYDSADTFDFGLLASRSENIPLAFGLRFVVIWSQQLQETDAMACQAGLSHSPYIPMPAPLRTYCVTLDAAEPL